MVAKTGERMGADRAFLFGRRTYGQLLASWNARKYVASSNPATKDWGENTKAEWVKQR